MNEVYKKYVDVISCDNADGSKDPLAIWWDKGVLYIIEKTTSREHCASLKAGGAGIKYTCVIEGHEKNIWLEDTRWFVEAKGEKVIEEHSTIKVDFWIVYTIQQN